MEHDWTKPVMKILWANFLDPPLADWGYMWLSCGLGNITGMSWRTPKKLYFSGKTFRWGWYSSNLLFSALSTDVVLRATEDTDWPWGGKVTHRRWQDRVVRRDENLWMMLLGSCAKPRAAYLWISPYVRQLISSLLEPLLVKCFITCRKGWQGPCRGEGGRTCSRTQSWF